MSTPKFQFSTQYVHDIMNNRHATIPMPFPVHCILCLSDHVVLRWIFIKYQSLLFETSRHPIWFNSDSRHKLYISIYNTFIYKWWHYCHCCPKVWHPNWLHLNSGHVSLIQKDKCDSHRNFYMYFQKEYLPNQLFVNRKKATVCRQHIFRTLKKYLLW